MHFEKYGTKCYVSASLKNLFENRVQVLISLYLKFVICKMGILKKVAVIIKENNPI